MNLHDDGEQYTSEILGCFQREGMKKYAILGIWDEDWMKRNGLKDPRNVFDELLLGYLHKRILMQTTFGCVVLIRF